ncbi:hypothetical protein [Neobacillus kokaensis]|uniref:DUF5673 domain-containing protein n=1 Tax=Neobacillus kokaensis TaxID=2759023 RepID=A0ABQ3N898_9BACI|nr:hypothetical protein [Neobacillus kokaensis]GHI00953.1 hypothetical protein AM1BK_44950 [Neobacillus kokaensis]
MIYIRKKESAEENSVKLVAYTIILYISSFFVPFVIVASFQSVVYYSRSQWFFATPFSAYITFMAGMFYIAIVFTFFLIFRQKWEGGKFKSIISLLLLISIPVFYLSLTNYYYVDDKGVHYNSLISISEEEYKWENVNTVHIIYRNHQGIVSNFQYKFQMMDGETITLPYDDKFSENIRRIEEKIQQYHIVVKDNFKNPIVD